MTDDLKERLLEGVPARKQVFHEGMTFDLQGAYDLQQEAHAYITDLEARLAAADKQRRESDEKLTNQRHEINWLKEQQQALKDSLAAAEAEVQRCHERLEITHVWRMKPGAEDLEDLERVEVPMEERASMPDAITCRDATIALLEEDIKELNALNIDKMDVLDSVWKRRAEAAEAGEDALAEALRKASDALGWAAAHLEDHGTISAQVNGGAQTVDAALAAYEARRKG